jgi:hypothetical protein
MKSEDGLGIEFDENVICDVCRSPDSEEANEMVFCDNCNICVHQACYGITTIPSGEFEHYIHLIKLFYAITETENYRTMVVSNMLYGSKT